MVFVDDATPDRIPPEGAVLATSSGPLGLDGEREYRLRPLPEAPAVELYRQRATAVDPSFDVSYTELAALTRRLGRWPGAIEAAAAGR